MHGPTRSTDLALTLRFTADLLDGLPGLPPVYVSAYADHVSLQVMAHEDQHRRRLAVDALCAVLGLTPVEDRARSAYYADGVVGGIDVSVYAPGLPPGSNPNPTPMPDPSKVLNKGRRP